LSSAGYRSELVDGVVERLLELGMLDDAAFARAWIESRDRARPRGERALRQELARKGIEREVVERLFEDRRSTAAASAAEDGSAPSSPDQAAAERLLAKHERALSRVVDPRQRRQRAYSLLARNGFDPEVCRTVAATVVDHPEPEDD
jgi:regulatory protein